ncbi:MAG: hypothetical protein CMN78_04210 [Spirochaetales bacterium]|nr:hypothetical protein [Spirochaetales bacterium]
MEGRAFRFFSFCILVAVSIRGESLELHGRSTAIVKNATLTLSDVAEFTSQSKYPRRDQALATIYNPTIIASVEIRRMIDEILTEPFVFIGGALACIPEEYARSGNLDFWESLSGFLDREVSGYGRIEIIPEEDFYLQMDAFGIRQINREIDFVLVATAAYPGEFRVLFRHATELTYRKIPAVIKAEGVISFQPDLVDEQWPQIPERTLVENRIHMQSGSQISVFVRAGAIQVILQGTALSSGSEDDTVRVKILETGKELDAIVLGPLEAQVVY